MKLVCTSPCLCRDHRNTAVCSSRQPRTSHWAGNSIPGRCSRIVGQEHTDCRSSNTQRCTGRSPHKAAGTWMKLQGHCMLLGRQIHKTHSDCSPGSSWLRGYQRPLGLMLGLISRAKVKLTEESKACNVNT